MYETRIKIIKTLKEGSFGGWATDKGLGWAQDAASIGGAAAGIFFPRHMKIVNAAAIAAAGIAAGRSYYDEKGIIPSDDPNLKYKANVLGQFAMGRSIGSQKRLMFLPGQSVTGLGAAALGAHGRYSALIPTLGTSTAFRHAIDPVTSALGAPYIPGGKKLSTKAPYGTASTLDISRGYPGEGAPTMLELIAAANARRQ